MKGNSTNNMIFGTRAISESILSGKSIDKLLLQRGINNDQVKEIVNLCKEKSVPFTKVPLEKLNRITNKNHQGVIAFLSPVHFASVENIIASVYENGNTPLVIILDRVTDVRNFGAVVRTAECAGVHAVIIPSKGSAAVNSDAMKTSAGALNYVPICRSDNLKETINYLKESGLQVIASTEKSKLSLYQEDFTPPTAILLGSEEDGVSPEYLKMADVKVAIPIIGNIASLNVSVSAAVVIYEIIRQRNMLNN